MSAGLADFLAAHDGVIEVRIAQARGSAPRETGAEMFVAADAVWGTIGGGRLEYRAIERARALLAQGGGRAEMDVPLGPAIGQCCGGHVVLALRSMDAPARCGLLRRIEADRAARPHLYIFGAGHVGRALADCAALLPLRVVLIDSRSSELAQCKAAVECRLTALPEAEIRAASANSAFVILTHDHALDFLLSAEALCRGDAAYVGMIGSATKRTRFESYLRSQGQGGQLAGLTCPIGDFGSADKRPEVIAACVAAEVVSRFTEAAAGRSGRRAAILRDVKFSA